jgi:hypothetical protein
MGNVDFYSPVYATGTSAPYTFQINYDNSTAGPQQSYAMVPMTPVAAAPEPVDDSALGWLRDQVEELRELARAA